MTDTFGANDVSGASEDDTLTPSPGPRIFRVVGLDLSITSTGMSDGSHHWVTQTPPDHPIERRIDRIVDRVGQFVHGSLLSRGPFPAHLADLVVIESGAFSRGSQSEGAEWLAALRYAVRVKLWQMNVPFAMVTPTALKSYTTGYGQATKPKMVEAVRDRHGIDLSGVKVKDGRYDLADAVALAAMGYRWLNDPLPTTGPPAPMKPLLSVKWPDEPKPYVEGE